MQASPAREQLNDPRGAAENSRLVEAADPQTKKILEHRRSGTLFHTRRRWLLRRLLLAGDLFALGSAFALTQAVAGGGSPFGGRNALAPLVAFVATLPLWVVAAHQYGLYARDEERPEHSTADDLIAIFHLVAMGTWLSYLGGRILGLTQPTFAQTAMFWASATVLIVAARAAARYIGRRRLGYIQNTVIVGAGEIGQVVARKFANHPEYGINLVGFVDSDPRERSENLRHVALLGSLERLPEIVALFDIERVVIAFSNESHERTLHVFRSLKDFDLQVDIVPRLFELVGPNVGLHMIEGLPMVSLPALRLSRSSLLIKRAVDIVVSAVALVTLAPLLAALALAVKRDSPGAVLYAGERVGREGRRFRLFKFRTMRREFCRGPGYGGEEAEAAFEKLMRDSSQLEEFRRTHKLARDPRVTRVGGFLRRTSLDELPQLINVLRGDISLVGPRPITVDELDDARLRPSSAPGEDEPESESEGDAGSSPLVGYWEIAHLRPGVTGYWQITGRSQISYEERLRLDMAYMQSWSLKLDLLIVAKTVRVLGRTQGAY